MRVLVVEDEKYSRDYLKKTLESELFAIDTSPDGEDGSYLARTNDYDLIILDQILPKKTGLQICTELRKSGKDTPIIMLSACCEVDDKTQLLNAGVDDYLIKPYSHSELVARIRAVLRRSTKQKPLQLYKNGNLILNADTQEVTLNGKGIYLTVKEYSLLELLLRHEGKVVSRGIIMEHVWNMDVNPLSKTIDTHMLNIRRKLETRKEKFIQSIPGRGYKIISR